MVLSPGKRLKKSILNFQNFNSELNVFSFLESCVMMLKHLR